MKRFAALAVIVALLATLMVMATPVSAAAPVAIIRFNGHPVFFDVEPIIQNGRTLVPFRAILETLGARVSYDAATQKVTADRFGTQVELTLGSSKAKVNGREVTIPDGVTAISYRGRTMIPLRFISESMGLTVRWDPQQRIANIIDTKWPKRGGTLQLSMWSSPEHRFNPILYESSYDNNIVSLVFQGLYDLDGQMRPYGSLARYWDVSADQKTITYYLDRGARFHDGTPVKAQDVKFTFEAIMHPQYTGVRDVFDYIVGHDEFKSGAAREVSGIKVIDDYTISFTSKYPWASMFWDLSFGILPKHLYGRTPVKDWVTARDPMARKPIGSGPFKFASMSEGQFYMVEAWEGFNLGRPYVDRIVYKVLSQETALAQLEVGALDQADLKITDLPTAQKMANINVIETSDFVWQYFGMNTAKAPFDNKLVRQAAAWAIDADAIVSQLMEGHGSRMYTPIYPLIWAYSEDVEKYPYNPAKAEALLKQAGFTKGSDGVYAKDGKKLEVELLYPTGNVVRMNSAPLIQSWLEAVGFKVTLTKMDFAAMFDRIDAGDVQAWLAAWAGGIPDPSPGDLWSKAQIGAFNFPRWWTPLSEELIDKQGKTLDIAQRKAILAEWQKHFADEVPVYPMYMPNSIQGVNKRVKNLKATAVGTFWNIWEIYLDF